MDKPNLSVVRSISDHPPLNDIPAQLEQMAKQIRDGKLDPISAVLVLVHPEDAAGVYQYGLFRGIHETHGILAHAQDIVASNFNRSRK